MVKNIAIVASLVTAINALPSSPISKRAFSTAATKQGNLWVVDGQYAFTNTQSIAFTDSLPAWLVPSESTILGTPPALDRSFTPSNAVVSDGYLRLTLPGGQTEEPIFGGEVSTVARNIRYASVRTTAILGDPAGACSGMFFYRDDSHELDIEWLSDAASGSNPGDGSRRLFYTNQALDGNEEHATKTSRPSPQDATTAEHEYRIDWVPGKALYYLDGELQATLEQNVPESGGRWIWNNWSNGNKGWSAGPPKETNVLKISNIVMYYNVSSV